VSINQTIGEKVLRNSVSFQTAAFTPPHTYHAF